MPQQFEKNTPDTIRKLLQAGNTPLLPYEYDFLKEQLIKLGVEQKQLGKLLGQAMEQSSETWHDNAPADAVNHQSRVLSKKAEKVIEGLGTAAHVDYPRRGLGSITLGSVIGVVYSGETDPDYLLVAGFCRERPNIKPSAPFSTRMDIATVCSPLGAALLGLGLGDTANYMVNHNKVSLDVASLHQLQAEHLR